MKQILFHRNYNKFKGGHLKVFNYFEHILHSNDYTPLIYFSKLKKLDESDPWKMTKKYISKKWEPEKTDILFLGGMDWNMVPKHLINNPSLPIINLIQHVRHSDPKDKRYEFLSNKAIRICVSPEVFNAVKNTNKANGPVFMIPNGINLNYMPKKIKPDKKYDFIIAALKKPWLGRIIYILLKKDGYKVLLLDKLLPRLKYLEHILYAHVSILLPNKEEGFYLPALEAMGLGTMVICPDCKGNRSFCIDKQNCIIPGYKIKDIMAAAKSTMEMPKLIQSKILNAAKKTSKKYSLDEEKRLFYRILNKLDELW